MREKVIFVLFLGIVAAWGPASWTARADADEPKAEASAATDSKAKADEKPRLVVSLALSGDLSESVAPPGLFGEIQKSLSQTIATLQRAADDDEVMAVVLRIRGLTVGRGKVHELRQAIREVRQKGKKVYADLHFASPADYLVASACDQVVMPESGTLLLPGVRAEVMFYKNLFDKLGVRADMLQVGDFKGAGEPYSRTEMSESFRRQYELVIDDLYDQMVDLIATDRQLSREVVVAKIDQGLFMANEAKEAGLIDLVTYDTELQKVWETSAAPRTIRVVRDYGRKKVDTDFSGMMGMVKLMEMLTGADAKKRSTSEQKIAIVHAVGAIVTGSSQSSLVGGGMVGSDTIVAALQAAERDETVVAIVLRIDSPGGSALASDLIWKQIRDCKKPVVASMGDVAASGGYYIAMGCDKIVAEPGTLTGSIGVVGGKLTLKGAMEKLGVSTDVISRGKHSGILSSRDAFSDGERERFQKMMETTYQQFTSKAAEGRKMSLERLLSLAGGRIWTGHQAHEHGLVDRLGTLDDAVAEAKQLAGVSADSETERLLLPKSRSFFEELFEEPEAAAQMRSLMREGLSRSALPLPHPILEQASKDLLEATILFEEPVLLWMPYRVEIR